MFLQFILQLSSGRKLLLKKNPKKKNLFDHKIQLIALLYI